MRKISLDVYKIDELPEDIKKVAIFYYQGILNLALKSDAFIWSIEELMFKMLPDKGFTLEWENKRNIYRSCKITGIIRDNKKFAEKFNLDFKGYNPDNFEIDVVEKRDKETPLKEWKDIDVLIYYTGSEKSDNSINFILEPTKIEELKPLLAIEIKAIVMGTAKTINDLILEKQIRAIFDDDYAYQELINLGIEFYKDGRVHTNLGKVKEKHWLVEGSSKNLEEIGLSDLEAA